MGIKMSENTQLPEKSALPPFELTVPKTNVTQEAINALQEKYKNLPDVTDEGGLDKLRKGRKEVKDVRLGAKDYCDEIKAQIKDIKTSIDDAYMEQVDKPIREIENRIDKKIKAEEERLKKIAAEKKRKAEEKRKKIDEKIASIKDISFYSIINVKVKDLEEHIRRLEEEVADGDFWDDRLSEYEFAKELTIEKLENLKKDVVKRDEENAKAAEREAELLEEKRVLDIKTKLKDFDQYIVEAVRAKTLNQLQDVYDNVEKMEISKAVFEEFFDEAINTRRETLEEVGQILQNMKDKIKADNEAKVEKEKADKEKVDLKKKADDLKKKEDDLKKKELEIEKKEKEGLLGTNVTKNDIPKTKPNVIKSKTEVVKPPKQRTSAPAPIKEDTDKIKQTPEQECYKYLYDLFDESTAAIFFEQLTAGNIPHIKAVWLDD